MLIDPYRFGGGEAIDDPFAEDTVALVQYHTGEVVERVGLATVEHPFFEGGGAVAGALSTVQKKFGTHSWFQNLPNDKDAHHYLRLSGPDDLFVFDGDFTIEGWFYLVGNPGGVSDGVGFINQWHPESPGPIWNPNGGASRTILIEKNGSATNADRTVVKQGYWSGTTVFSGVSAIGSTPWIPNLPDGPSILNRWAHLALTRGPSNNLLKFWIDGVLDATCDIGSGANNWTGPLGWNNNGVSYLNIGSKVTTGASQYDFAGYWDQIRITKACRYTDSFTPPDEPFWT